MFSANDVKALRERTAAGMMECKKALEATNGDMEKAIDWLRENGTIKAAKKQGRIAAEGLTKILENDQAVAMVEVNSETDFVAKNPDFQEAVEKICNAILNSNVTTMDEALKLTIGSDTIESFMTNLTATIGEKLSFRRFARIEKKEGQTIGTYSHMGGRIGVIIVLDGGNVECARDIAMHTAAMRPMYLTRDDVDKEVLDRESTVIKEQAMKEGKPEEIANKMVTGRLNKFYKEICLNEQDFVKNGDITIEAFAKQNNATVASMTRFEVGEGIEKKQEDFASEVMSQLNG